MSCSASEKKISVASSVSARHSFSCSSEASPCEIAFWKIVGFDVTPVTASSSIIRFSSPLRTSSRESVSNQTDWPRSVSPCSRDLAILHLLFHGGDLQQPLDVALAAVEGRLEKRLHQLARERRPHDLGAEAEHVHVVVLDALVRAVGVVADRRADAGELAGGDGRAHSRAADEDAARGLAALDRLADLARLVGIVDAHRVGVRAEVEDVVAGKRLEHRLAQMDAAVVERDRDLHATRSSSAVARATTLSRL